MTKEEIFAKLQTEVTIRGLSPGTYDMVLNPFLTNVAYGSVKLNTFTTITSVNAAQIVLHNAF